MSTSLPPVQFFNSELERLEILLSASLVDFDNITSLEKSWDANPPITLAIQLRDLQEIGNSLSQLSISILLFNMPSETMDLQQKVAEAGQTVKIYLEYLQDLLNADDFNSTYQKSVLDTLKTICLNTWTDEQWPMENLTSTAIKCFNALYTNLVPADNQLSPGDYPSIEAANGYLFNEITKYVEICDSAAEIFEKKYPKAQGIHLNTFYYHLQLCYWEFLPDKDSQISDSAKQLYDNTVKVQQQYNSCLAGLQKLNTRLDQLESEAKTTLTIPAHEKIDNEIQSMQKYFDKILSDLCKYSNIYKLTKPNYLTSVRDTEIRLFAATNAAEKNRPGVTNPVPVSRP